MSTVNKIYIALFISCLSGCSSWSTTLKYREASYIPGAHRSVIGYRDEKLGEMRYQIYAGQAWPKDWQNLSKIAIYRAADLTVQNGYKYFTVISDFADAQHYAIPGNSTTRTTANVVGNAVYATSYTTHNSGGSISGGTYYLDFLILKDDEVNSYEKVFSAEKVMNELRFFIESRK